MEAVAKQATVIVFGKNEVAGSSDAPVCICDSVGSSEIVKCKTCLTEYHIDCVAWKVVPGAKAAKYECGFCEAGADQTGVRYWEGDIGDQFEEDVNEGKLHRNDKEVEKQGRGKMRKRIGEEQQASWANVIDRVRKHADLIHEEKKKQHERAKARIKEGGHHVVDRAGGGGVQEVPVTDQVIDLLEGMGEI